MLLFQSRKQFFMNFSLINGTDIVNHLWTKNQTKFQVSSIFLFFLMKFRPFLIFFLLALAMAVESEAVDRDEVWVNFYHGGRRLGEQKYITMLHTKPSRVTTRDLAYIFTHRFGCQMPPKQRAYAYSRPCTVAPSRIDHCVTITDWRLYPEERKKT